MQAILSFIPTTVPPVFPFSEEVFVALVSLVVGGIGIYVGGRIVLDKGNYRHAFFTAVIGAVVWVVVDALVGGIAMVGPVLALIAWVWVVKKRYSTDWLNAVLVAVVAWVSAIIVLYVLDEAMREISATGIPGV